MNPQETLFDDEDDTEGGSDYKVTPSDFSDIFVIPSDWTVSTLRRELVEIIDLEPHFQRRSVWTVRAKSKFIESLILGIPIPQILLAERLHTRNEFLVLDGKQRLSAIAEFFSEPTGSTAPFRLQGLDDLTYLNGKSWEDLKNGYTTEARAIEAASIRTAVIRGWQRDDVLYEIFHRLNSGSVKLSPMELRMSLIRGPFVREVINQTAGCTNLQAMLGLQQPDKRMKDVEVAIRHLAFQDFSIEYAGNLKDFLDDFCRKMNGKYTVGQKIDGVAELESMVSVGLKIFEKGSFSRKYIPESDQFEGAFNRAIFDVLGGSLANAPLRAAAFADHARFLDLYKRMFSNNSFVRSIESTTKSISATKYRFSVWYSAIEKEYGISIPLPLMKDNA